MIKIYVLVEPTTLKIRYIGITKEKYLSKRLGGHKYDSINRNGNTHHHRWFRKMYKNNTKPIIRKIAEAPTWEDARKIELELIKKYKKKHNLTNTYDEGKFTKSGKKSARIYLSKPIYEYNCNGDFVQEYKITKELCDKYKITNKTVDKILRRKGRAKYGMKYHFQLSRVKVNKMLPLLKTSNAYNKPSTKVI